jgi:hypothetical protein
VAADSSRAEIASRIERESPDRIVESEPILGHQRVHIAREPVIGPAIALSRLSDVF